MDINTCYALTVDDHVLAYYTHIFPIITSLVLATFMLIRTHRSLLSRVFFYFTLGFVFWLICDLVTWTTQDYYLVPFFWSMFDYINIVFFLYGLYFLLVVINKRDISPAWKWFGFVLTLPALYIVVTGNSVHEFDQATCGDGLGDDFLNTYKNIIEVLVMGGILVSVFLTWTLNKFKEIRLPATVIGVALLIFFLTFTVTDYISVATDVYQTGLYGLLVMPVFLGLIVYSIVTFQTFSANIFGSQLLVLSLMALVASEFLFVTNPINRILVALTFVLAGFFGVVLVRGVQREVRQRQHIEELASELDITNSRQETLIHFIGHEVKGFLTKDAGAFAALSEGDLGPISDGAKAFAESALTQSRAGAASVGSILKASNLKKGTVTYDKKPFNLNALVVQAVANAKSTANAKGLTISFTAGEGNYQMVGDGPQIADHVLRNLIENAINYTPTGSIEVSLQRSGDKIAFAVKDSGIGISAGDKKYLFTEGGHGKDSQKVNAHSTGYGLYIAKQIVEAHGGTIRAESEGVGKGSTFVAEFPT